MQDDGRMQTRNWIIGIVVVAVLAVAGFWALKGRGAAEEVAQAPDQLIFAKMQGVDLCVNTVGQAIQGHVDFEPGMY